MKRPTFLVFAVSAALLGLLSSSQGVAEAQNRDRTGAPGSDPDCTVCHNGSTSASASFEVVDAVTQEAATAYTPGQEYLVRMVIAGGDAASVYGMQSTVVLADGSNAGTFSAPSGNAQLENVDERHIVEHNFSSASNVFEVNWTAPAAGSGNADFYMSAMESNGNGSTNGDGSIPATLSLPEVGDTSGTDGLAMAPATDWARPLPLGEMWTWTAPETGRLVVSDLSGRVLEACDANAGQQLDWPAQAMNVAVYVTDRGQRQTWKLAGR